jgi:ubiquinone biosynthesis protein COQ4
MASFDKYLQKRQRNLQLLLLARRRTGFSKRSSLMRKILALVRFGYASLRFVKDPRRLDEVLAIMSTINDKTEVQRIVNSIKSRPLQSAALQSRPKLGKIDIAKLAALPEGTLGKEYATYLQSHGFGTEDIKVESESKMAGTEEEYVVNYFYETHDIYHVVTGFNTDFAGELGLQAYYATAGPGISPLVILTLGLLNTLFFAREDKDNRLAAIARGWYLGRQSENLFGVDWKALWSKPLAQVRGEFRIKEVPLLA